MESIDARIEILRRRSNAILLSIAGLLVCASFVIVFAGQLTNLDASASSNIDRLKSEVSSTKSKLGLLDQANDLLMQKDKLNNNDKDKDSISKQLQSLSSSYDNDFQLPMSMSAFTQLSITESDHLRTMEKLLDDAWSKDISTERGYDDTRYVIASAITRIGVVLVIVFLVQILIGLFRYNSRLVTFYSSRRDILQMWSGELKNFVTLESILAPKIDFGKEPKHPIDEIIQRIIQKVPTVPSVTGTDLK